MQIKYMRGFSVKFLGPTNYRGARVRITDMHRRESIVIDYDYVFNNCLEIAAEYLKKLGIECICRTGDKEKDYLLTDNFGTNLATAIAVKGGDQEYD